MLPFNSYIKSPQKFVLCYLSVACSQFLACFTVQFSRCRSSDLFQGQIETLRICKMLQSNLGGDKRDRTADLLNAIQALSQLSYTPIFVVTDCISLVSTFSENSLIASFLLFLVNPLRWASLGFRIRFIFWWAQVDSNHRPHDYQSCALAS